MKDSFVTKLHRLFVSIALIALRALRLLGKGIFYLGMLLAPLGQSFFHRLIRWFLLPVYRVFLYIRIHLGRLITSTHGLIFLIFTNRYVMHGAILLIAIATIATQLQPQHAYAGQPTSSVLYTLVTDGQDELVDEPIRPDLLTKDTNYLGVGTIEALPAIDYDYESDTQTAQTDLTIPGSIAYQDTGTMSQAPSSASATAAPAPSDARTETEMYVVKANDTVASIAQKFNVNVGTIVWANGLDARATIKPGDTLKIPVVSGVLYAIKKGDTIAKIASLYHVNADDIVRVNQLTAQSVLTIGSELTIPNASPIAVAKPQTTTPTKAPVAVVTASKTKIALKPNIPISRIKGKTFDIYQELTGTSVDTRVKPPDIISPEPETGKKLLWPSRLHAINQYYGWAHTGIDIRGDYTDPIYAADDGVVEKAGWNSGGYGLMIFINHENGYKTRYGHASKLFVQEGDHVKRGQVIGMIGTTGRSTGTHLHFEVYVNGTRVNPLSYVER